MKFSKIIFAGSTSAAEADDTAISTLKYLEEVSLKIVSSELIDKRSGWKQRWSRRMKKNNDRMRNSFEKCGTNRDERDDEIDVKYETGDSCLAIKELMNGYSEWVERYISSCNGQRNYSHQKRRIEKWKNLFNKGKG